MATIAGISTVAGVSGAWVNLPAVACENVMLQRGGFDIGFSAAPGNNHFNINPDIPPFWIPVISNADTLWIRAVKTGTIQFLYNSP